MQASINKLLRRWGWLGAEAPGRPIEAADGSEYPGLVAAQYSGLDLLDPTTWAALASSPPGAVARAA